ncbi:MAG: hypothetical protein MZU95_07880 [Desulfomicrobium escambiense]|nr:hypothetical protein [Desulfomicrobium escambiense]
MLGNEAIAQRARSKPGWRSLRLTRERRRRKSPRSFFRFPGRAICTSNTAPTKRWLCEVAAGAAMCGLRAMVTMKHVGLNVAADALMTLAYTGVVGRLGAGGRRRSVHVFQPERTGQPLLRQAQRPAHAGAVLRGRGQGDDPVYAFDLSEELKLPVHPAHHHPHQPLPAVYRNPGRRAAKESHKGPSRKIPLPMSASRPSPAICTPSCSINIDSAAAHVQSEPLEPDRGRRADGASCATA